MLVGCAVLRKAPVSRVMRGSDCRMHACWTGWWAESGAWVPRDWALRPSYDTRVAIINALYACGENVQRLMPIMVAEAVRRDRRAPISSSKVL